MNKRQASPSPTRLPVIGAESASDEDIAEPKVKGRDDDASMTDGESQPAKPTQAATPLTPRTKRRREADREATAQKQLIVALRTQGRQQVLLQEAEARNNELRLENLAKSKLLEQQDEERKTRHLNDLPSQAYVTALPVISWAELPQLNFDDMGTIYPYLRKFDIVTRTNGCPPALKQTHFRTLPGAAEGCVSTMLAAVDKCGDIVSDEYEVWRNIVLRKLGYLDPVTALLLRMTQRIPQVKGTTEWILLARSTNAELQIALEAWPDKYTSKGVTIALLTATASAYSGNERLKLHRKIRDREDSPGLLDWILGSLPKWEVNIFTRAKDAEIATAAAATYRPTEKTRPPKNRQAREFASKTPKRFDAKRTDVPRRKDERPKTRGPCRNCGGTHGPRACPAWGKQCSTCNLFNHVPECCKTGRTKVKSD
jgi:hypothetical protein